MTETTHPTISQRARRERGFDDIASTIEHLYGPRCPRTEGGCTTCAAWAIFDALDTMTDASLFEDETEKDAAA